MERLIALFEKHRNPVVALGMAKYMKDQFPYLGIKTPERRSLFTLFLRESEMDMRSLDQSFVSGLWALPEREYQYAAVDYLIKIKRQLAANNMEYLKGLIINKSWWDTIDPLASVVIGDLAARNPSVVPEYIDGWSSHANIWLRRTAILFQLKYKAKTDERLLYQFIGRSAESKEFFLQKAIGWALREYSKTNPDSVRKFIHSTSLARLSVREGSKYL